MVSRVSALALFGLLCLLAACGGSNGASDAVAPTVLATGVANTSDSSGTPTPAASTAPSAGAALPRDLLGTWTCYSLSSGAGSTGSCAITVTIQADGSYQMGQGVGGTVSAAGKTLTFVGQGGIEKWGPATIVKPGRMDFQWTDADGYKHWAVFYKNGSDQVEATPSAQEGSQTQTQSGEVSVSPSSAAAGTKLTVSTRGIPPSAQMQVCVYNSSGRAIDCPKATSTADGALTVALDTSGYAPGPYTITILDSFSIPQAFRGKFTISQ